MDIAFEKLIRLQNVDTEIARLQSLLNAVPSRLEAIDEQIRTTTAVVAQAKDKLAANQKSRRDLEGEVKLIREAMAKYKRQLNDVKTNKEHDAIKKEISETQAKIEAIEETILNAMISADDIEKDIKTAQTSQIEEESRLKRDKDAVAAEKAELERLKSTAENERAALRPGIPADQLKLYERICQKKAGVAMSRVIDDFCSLCQMRIRPQLLDELMGLKKIITCEACGRILYWIRPKDEDIPEETDHPNRKDDSS